MSAPRFVAVRIAVAVNALGEWVAEGWDEWTDAQSAAAAVLANDEHRAPSRVTFVVALVPLPTDVIGEVQK